MAEPSQLRRLGRYRLRYRVAQGGMASVYLAQLDTDAGFSKWVALKTIHPHIAEDPHFVTMFLDEARLAARLDHPQICSVFDFGEAEGTYYIAMEYLHGESLERIARRCAKEGGLEPRLAARIVADAARGLHHAHELKTDDGRPANVVHRDVSPQNIFVLHGGGTKVVDFGIARSEQRAAERTKTGELKGKLAYMAPEMLRSASEVDRRADVWALGVVLWEITLGRRLFRRSNPGATVAAIMEPAPSPASMRPGYPALLDRIVTKALAQRRDERYQTAAELCRDLERFLASTGEPCTAEDVAGFMEVAFADEKAERQQLLARQDEAPRPEVVETPSETSVPIGRDATADEVRPPPGAESAVPAVEPRKGRRLIIAVAVLAGLLLGAASAIVAVAPWNDEAEVPAVQMPSERGVGEPEASEAGAGEAASAERADGERAEEDREGADADRAGGAGLGGGEGDGAQLAAAGGPGDGEPAETDGDETDGDETDGDEAEAGEADADEAEADEAEAAPERRGRRHGRRGGRGRSAASADPLAGALDFGFVTVTTNPRGVQVYEGARLLGRTPLQRRLSVGNHTLRLVTPSGSSHRVPVRIEPGATSVLSIDVQ